MLTPDDIAQRRFLVALRGYDRDEVTTFLEEVAGEVRALRKRSAELEARLKREEEVPATEAGDTRAALEALGRETTRVLVAADEAAREIESSAAVAAQEHRDEAARQARETVEQANRQAARMIAEAERRRDAVAAEIAALDEERTRFLEGLRASMASIGGVVGGLSGTGPGDEPAVPEPTEVVVAPDPGTPEIDEATASVLLEEEMDSDAVTAAEPAASTDAPAAPADAPADITTELPAPEATDEVPDVDASDEAADEPTPVADEPDEPEVAAERPTVADRRDAALQELRDEMGRQSKRGMQEVQNEVLASIRDRGRSASLDDLLPGEDELDDLGARASDPLARAYRQALADAADEVEAATPEGRAEERVQAAVGRFRTVLSHEIISALRATLRAGLEADEPAPQLSERVGEAFRDLRGPVIESTVEEHLQRTYAHGLLDAWQQLGIEQVQWQAAQEPRCPEGRCRTNAAEGIVAIGEAFPSGDAVPPAHQGCSCVVVPAVIATG